MSPAVKLTLFGAVVFVGSFAATLVVVAGLDRRARRWLDATVELDEVLGRGWPEVWGR